MKVSLNLLCAIVMLANGKPAGNWDGATYSDPTSKFSIVMYGRHGVLFCEECNRKAINTSGDGYNGGALPGHGMPYDAIGQLENNQFGFANDVWGKRYDLDPIRRLFRN